MGFVCFGRIQSNGLKLQGRSCGLNARKNFPAVRVPVVPAVPGLPWSWLCPRTQMMWDETLYYMVLGSGGRGAGYKVQLLPIPSPFVQGRKCIVIHQYFTHSPLLLSLCEISSLHIYMCALSHFFLFSPSQCHGLNTMLFLAHCPE